MSRERRGREVTHHTSEKEMGTGREWIREGEATWGNVTVEKGVSSGSSILPLSLVPAFSPSFRVAEIT